MSGGAIAAACSTQIFRKWSLTGGRKRAGVKTSRHGAWLRPPDVQADREPLWWAGIAGHLTLFVSDGEKSGTYGRLVADSTGNPE